MSAALDNRDVAPGGVIDRLKAWYFRVIVWLAVFLTVALVGIMGVQVFFRYVLNDSLIWAEEVCRYILVWSTFLFAGAAFQRGEMVSIELLVGRFRSWGRLVFIVPGYVAALALLGVIMWYGYVFAALNQTQTIPAADFIWASIIGSENASVGLSVFWIYISVPFGCGILFLHLALSLAGMVAAAFRGEDLRPVSPTEEIPPEGWGA